MSARLGSPGFALPVSAQSFLSDGCYERLALGQLRVESDDRFTPRTATRRNAELHLTS